MAWNLSCYKNRPRETVPSWPDGAYRLVLIDTHGKLVNVSQICSHVYDLERRSIFTDTSSLSDSHRNLASAIVARGYIPTSPHKPAFAISVRTMELFWALSCHAHTSRQAMTRVLCQLHNVSFHIQDCDC